MQIHKWDELSPKRQGELLRRPPPPAGMDVQRVVADIIEQVRHRGDQAIRQLAQQLDGLEMTELAATGSEIQRSARQLPSAIRQAIDTAYDQIFRFHESARPQDLDLETCPGVTCGVRYTGIHRVGLYAPGGRTPLPSTVLMMGVPAQIAQCHQRVLCCPPRSDGTLDPAIAYAAQLCQIQLLFKIGGAQAIAAMAWGTESVPACDKLFGPGSVWVTEAKRQVALSSTPVTIDMPAGPSEVLVIADDTANPDFVAADLMAQAEHGSDSQAVLVTNSRQLAESVISQIDRRVSELSRNELIEQSLRHSPVILVQHISTAIEVSNAYAPEHLIIQTEGADSLVERVTAAGSVFVGHWTPEVLGDYCSGTNHVLPTGGFARSVNGLSVGDFMKRITVQRATAEGLTRLAPAAAELAAWEGLTAHRLAIDLRWAALQECRP